MAFSCKPLLSATATLDPRSALCARYWFWRRFRSLPTTRVFIDLRPRDALAALRSIAQLLLDAPLPTLLPAPFTPLTYARLCLAVLSPGAHAPRGPPRAWLDLASLLPLGSASACPVSSWIALLLALRVVDDSAGWRSSLRLRLLVLSPGALWPCRSSRAWLFPPSVVPLDLPRPPRVAAAFGLPRRLAAGSDCF